MKKIAIFGSTGSIGTQTLDFIRKHDGFKADIIVANSNAELLIEQIKEFSPSVAGIINSKAYEKLKSEGLDVKLVTGDEAVNVCAQSGYFGGRFFGYACITCMYKERQGDSFSQQRVYSCGGRTYIQTFRHV